MLADDTLVSQVLNTSGYLSAKAYCPTSEQQLLEFGKAHRCPCCQTQLYLTLTHWQMFVRGVGSHWLLSANQRCSCGFEVPFHALVTLLKRQRKSEDFIPYSTNTTYQAHAFRRDFKHVVSRRELLPQR